MHSIEFGNENATNILLKRWFLGKRKTNMERKSSCHSQLTSSHTDIYTDIYIDIHIYIYIIYICVCV